jgi:hypothetical protein
MVAATGYTIPANKHIKLAPNTAQPRTVTSAAGGFALFTLDNANTSLTLEGNGGAAMTLSGGNLAAVSGRLGVYVNNGASELIMNTGSVISGFNNGVNGGGVFVTEGKFTLNNGDITDNRADYGAGVYVNGGTFEMEGGSISGNTAAVRGGGVYVNGGTFTMSGGHIYGVDAPALTNNAPNGDSADSGAAVYVQGGTAVYSGVTYGTSGIGTTNNTLPAQTPVAQIVGTGSDYASLADAIAAVPAGGNIYNLTEIYIKSDITLPESGMPAI